MNEICCGYHTASRLGNEGVLGSYASKGQELYDEGSGQRSSLSTLSTLTK